MLGMRQCPGGVREGGVTLGLLAAIGRFPAIPQVLGGRCLWLVVGLSEAE